MSLTRVVSLSLRIGLGTAWGAVLVVLGLTMLTGGLGLPPWRIFAPAGVAAITAGMFVFMVFVADRLVPSVGVRQLMWPVEMGTAAVCLLAMLVAILVLSRGGVS